MPTVLPRLARQSLALALLLALALPSGTPALSAASTPTPRQPVEPDCAINSDFCLDALLAESTILTPNTVQSFNQDSTNVGDVAESNDRFGSTLAIGDYNADGFDDLIIGTPDEFNLGNRPGDIRSGAVHVLQGNTAGLRSLPDLYRQGASGLNGRLGSAVGAANIDPAAGQRQRIVVGVPGQDGSAAPGMGEIWGFDAQNDRLSNFFLIRQRSEAESSDGAGETEDAYGSAFVVADFNGDGIDDLAAGIPNEDIGSNSDAGAVQVHYGPNITTGRVQWLTQATPDIPGATEPGDRFGSVLEAGDFNGDGYDDLAIGTPQENLKSVVDAGTVYVVYGSMDGLNPLNSILINQDSDGVNSSGEPGDLFGAALAAGDFNGDGYEDLAVGVPSEDEGTEFINVGAINIFYGSETGLSGSGSDYYSQGQSGLTDERERDDQFGFSLAAGDFNGDFIDDLAVGVPFEDTEQVDGGIVHILLGKAGAPTEGGGLQGEGSFRYTQRTFGFQRTGRNDRFGWAMTVGDFNADGYDDLAISSPGDTVGSSLNAGSVAMVRSVPRFLHLPLVHR